MAVPLALSIGVVAFLWSEFTLNFNLHWFTVADGVFGKFGLPEKFQFVLPGDVRDLGPLLRSRRGPVALRKTLISPRRAMGAIVIMTLGPALAGLPNLWGISLAIAIVGGGLVILSSLSADDRCRPRPRSPARPRCCSGGSPRALTTTSQGPPVPTPWPRSASR